VTEIKTFSELHVFLKPGELLDCQSPHEFYKKSWDLARADSFQAAG
jgi:hypothetical protein